MRLPATTTHIVFWFLVCFLSNASETKSLTPPPPNNGMVHDALHVEYHAMAPWYDKFWKAYLDQTLIKPLKLVQDSVKDQSSVVLDVACGTGVFLQRLMQQQQQQQRCKKLIGVEPSAAMLQVAKAKFANNIEWHQAPAEALPLPDQYVDLVTCTNAFHFFVDKHQALQEMYRTLKHGQGKLIISDWCNDYLLVRLYHALERIRWWKFKKPYPGPLSSQTMVDLVQAAGFENVQIETYTVRFWFVVVWGMHTLTATKPSQAKI